MTRGQAPVRERLRYLGSFAEHATAAAALRATRPVTPPRSEKLRVAFLSPHPPSHLGTVIRFTRWIPHLEQLGCEIEVLTATDEETFAEYRRRSPGADTRYHHVALQRQVENIRRAARADVVVIHRGLLPFSPWQRPTFERRLARLNPRLVYDYYDPIWIERRSASEESPSRLGRWLHPPDKIEQLIRLARVVTVSNEPLARFARRWHEDVRIVPMLVEPDDYLAREHVSRSPVVLGWTGSANNLPRLRSIAPALRRLAAEREVVVRVVAPEHVELDGVPVESLTHPWSADGERDDFASFDIGLLPLDPDSPSDREKSPFKLVQYMAAGLPVVANPVAVDTSVVKPGQSFLAAESDDEWVEAMVRLVDDAAMRAQMGAAARATVVEHYTFAGHAQAFLDVLLTAAGRGRA